MCWQCIGKPLVEFQWGIERWCISWQSATPIQPHPQCFALVTRYLWDDTQKTLFAHYTCWLWLIPDWSVTKLWAFSCIGQHLGHLLVDISVTSNYSRPKYWSLCQLSVSDLLVIRRWSNDWLLTDYWPMDYSGWLLVETRLRLDWDSSNTRLMLGRYSDWNVRWYVANPQDTWSDSSTYSRLHKTLPYKLCILIHILISGQLHYWNLFRVQRVTLTGKLPLYVQWDSSDGPLKK